LTIKDVIFKIAALDLIVGPLKIEGYDLSFPSTFFS